MFEKTFGQKCIVAQIALDEVPTMLSLFQKTLLHKVAFRVFGGEVVVDMKADDWHLNKTIKDHVYNALNSNTIICKGQPKAKPLKEPHNCGLLPAGKATKPIACPIASQQHHFF